MKPLNLPVALFRCQALRVIDDQSLRRSKGFRVYLLLITLQVRIHAMWLFDSVHANPSEQA